MFDGCTSLIEFYNKENRKNMKNLNDNIITYNNINNKQNNDTNTSLIEKDSMSNKDNIYPSFGSEAMKNIFYKNISYASNISADEEVESIVFMI